MNRILEVCAADVESALAASRGGAQRIELCTGLSADGLTPSAALIAAARAIPDLKMHVLIRPREGDFVYTPSEEAVMMADIGLVADLGADGVVIGALTPEGEIDIPMCMRLAGKAHARGLQVTFHRAFDRCIDPFNALEQIIAMGCSRLLTSGQAPTAEEGIAMLRKLNEQAAGRIIIMPGAGVNPANAAKILAETGCTEIHSSARHPGHLITSPDLVKNILDYSC